LDYWAFSKTQSHEHLENLPNDISDLNDFKAGRGTVRATIGLSGVVAKAASQKINHT
jgi:hypothetical protein